MDQWNSTGTIDIGWNDNCAMYVAYKPLSLQPA